MRRFAALLSLPLLLLAACGDAVEDDDADTEASSDVPDDLDIPEPEQVEAPAPDDDLLDDIEVSGDFGEQPEVSFEAPIESDQTVRRVLSEGDGPPAEYGEDFGVDYVAFDGETGEEVDNTYDIAMMPLTPMDEMMVPEFLAEAILDVPMGSRLVTVMSMDDPALPAAEGEEDAPAPTVVMVADVHGPEEVELDSTPPDDLPQVTLFNVGPPEVEVPDGDAPADLEEVVLVEGDGDEVASDDYVVVNTYGVLWDGGEEFDSSYARGGPDDFPLDGVIEGWTEGLAGQSVGSTVLLVVPPEMGYGDEGSEPAVPGGATLVFVVEILDAVDQDELAESVPEEDVETDEESDAEEDEEGEDEE